MKRIAIATLLAASMAAGAADVKVVAVTQVSPTLPQYTRVDQPLLRDGLQKASNGRIEVKLASWPEMNVGGPEVLRLVRSGQVDIAAVPLTTVSGDVPLLDGADLAGMNLEIGQARKVANALVPHANAELERLGIKLVATYPFSGQMLFCRKPIAQLTDIRNLKVRTFGPSSTELVKALGGQPVSMAFGEVYTALERGTVDCAITGSGSGNGVKWPEVTTHLYTQPLFWAVAGYFVNLSWWNKLAPVDRALIEKTLIEVQEKQWALGLEATLDGVACNVGRADGCKIHTLAKKPMTEVVPAADVRATIQKELQEDVLPGWLKRCGEKCSKVYAEVLAPIVGVKAR
ncbi:MAG TPA: TRAP transporter substrate-binding protein [Ramlibacter sp.]|nr:TRAP transporter substrate-binding protein [Ramlibacter sp.]